MRMSLAAVLPFLCQHNQWIGKERGAGTGLVPERATPNREPSPPSAVVDMPTPL